MKSAHLRGASALCQADKSRYGRALSAVVAAVGHSDAVEKIERRARTARPEAARRWAESGLDFGPIEEAEQLLAGAGRVTVNFHPDRTSRSGHSVAAGLAAGGFYKSQWATGVSAGSRSAMVGGERHRFELEFFDGAYERTDPASGDHPVYGALDLLQDEHGGAPRFGSCFLVLGSHVRQRATLSLGDSHLVPPDVGTFREPMGILAGLAEQAAQGRLLNRSLGRDSLAQVLRGGDRCSTASRDLDGYVEAQVHGGVSLAEDVDEVVLDPSFRGTGIERDLALAAKRYGFEIRWHSGSELHINDVPSDFRGPEMPELAARVARPDGLVDAHAIGVAAAKERFEEPTLLGDPPDAPLQQLKYLWHTLLAYGVAIA